MLTKFRDPEAGAFVLRVSLGAIFLAHGLLKLLVFTPEGTAAYFESIGMPGILGYAVMVGEILGGAALILGILTELVCFLMLPILVGSIVFSHWGNGWLFSNPGGGWEFPALLLTASIAQILMGPGKYVVRKH